MAAGEPGRVVYTYPTQTMKPVWAHDLEKSHERVEKLERRCETLEAAYKAVREIVDGLMKFRATASIPTSGNIEMMPLVHFHGVNQKPLCGTLGGDITFAESLVTCGHCRDRMVKPEQQVDSLDTAVRHLAVTGGTTLCGGFGYRLYDRANVTCPDCLKQIQEADKKSFTAVVQQGRPPWDVFGNAKPSISDSLDTTKQEESPSKSIAERCAEIKAKLEARAARKDQSDPA